MKEEYLELVQLTRRMLSEQYPSGARFESALKWQIKEAKSAPLPPPPIAPLQIPKFKPSAPLPKPLEVKADPLPVQEIRLSPKAKAPEESGNETLALLKRLFPKMAFCEPPAEFYDLCFLHDAVELSLYSKIQEALSKRGIKAKLLDVEKCSETDLHAPAKALIATKELLKAAQHLHPFAKRGLDNRPYLGSLPVLIAPETLKTPEEKKSFWELLLQAAKK